MSDIYTSLAEVIEKNGAASFWVEFSFYERKAYKELLYAAQDETAKELEAIKNDCLS